MSVTVWRWEWATRAERAYGLVPHVVRKGSFRVVDLGVASLSRPVIPPRRNPSVRPCGALQPSGGILVYTRRILGCNRPVVAVPADHHHRRCAMLSFDVRRRLMGICCRMFHWTRMRMRMLPMVTYICCCCAPSFAVFDAAVVLVKQCTTTIAWKNGLSRSLLPYPVLRSCR